MPFRLPPALASRHVLLLIPGYCLLHLALRVWASPNLTTDDVEQAIFAQVWAWGYNPTQPPLYTWLLLLAYLPLGPGAAAHALVKYGLLGATYAFAYLSARRLLAEPWRAALAAAALLLLFVFGWGVHAGFTHSVLLSACQFAALLALQRVVERRGLADYLLLGLAIGLGLLSKYSFVMFALPLVGGALLVPALRPAVLDRRMILALAIAATIFLPHGLWMLSLGRDYGRVLGSMAGVDAHASYLRNVAAGLLSLAEATIVFLSPFWLLAGVALWPARRALAAADPWIRLLALVTVAGLACMAATVFVAEATYFKERRMHAVLLTVPLLAMLAAARAGLGWEQLRWLAGAAALIAVAAVAGVVGQALFEPKTCRNCRLHAPFPALAEALQAAGFSGGTVLAGDEHVGGNMRARFPQARVLTPVYAGFRPPAHDGTGRCLLVWNSRGRDELPAALQAFAAELGAVPEAPRHVGLPLIREPERQDRFGFAFATNADGACRPR